MAANGAAHALGLLVEVDLSDNPLGDSAVGRLAAAVLEAPTAPTLQVCVGGDLHLFGHLDGVGDHLPGASNVQKPASVRWQCVAPLSSPLGSPALSLLCASLCGPRASLCGPCASLCGPCASLCGQWDRGGDGCPFAACAAVFSLLQVLRLRRVGMGAAGMSAVLAGLAINSSLRELDCSHNQVGMVGLQAWAHFCTANKVSRAHGQAGGRGEPSGRRTPFGPFWPFAGSLAASFAALWAAGELRGRSGPQVHKARFRTAPACALGCCAQTLRLLDLRHNALGPGWCRDMMIAAASTTTTHTILL